ncbi:MAG: hypothetical protein EXS13_00150 [Planctomycetes bacterium]|nr:hypothetical protein [Planctomycetota bacterium]
MSGATLSSLDVLHGAAKGDQFGHTLGGLADMNRDGADDFAVTSLDGGAQELGSVEVRSGADGTVLWSVEGFADSATAHVYFGVALAGGDWNGDDVGDLAIGDSRCREFDPATNLWSDLGRVELWFGAPAFSSGYGAGWPGTNGIPALDALNDPGLDQAFDLAIGNSAGVATTALLLVGSSPISIPYKDGTLLSAGDVHSVFFVLPGGGMTLSENIPDDPALAFVVFYVQVLEADAAASRKISFTAGLQVRIGYDLP